MDVEAVEQDTVVAGAHALRLVAILAGNALAGKFYVAIDGHQPYVAQVTAAGAAQVHLAEADNLLARLVIARAPVPTHLNLRGAGIHHAERHVGTDEDVPVVARTDAGVNILCKVIGHR